MNFAHVYDKFMEYVDYSQWYDFIMNYIKNKKTKIENVLEIGCGTGEFLLLFQKDNYNIIGVDLSEDMLSIAQEKLSKISGKDMLLHQNMLALDTGRKNDIIVSFFDTINYLISLEELKQLFVNVSQNLADDGLFLFDTATRNLMNDMFREGLFFDDRKDMTIIWEHYYNQDSQLDEIATTFFVKNDKNSYERVDDFYEKKIFEQEEIELAAKYAGLIIDEVFENNSFAGERKFYCVKKAR